MTAAVGDKSKTFHFKIECSYLKMYLGTVTD